LLPWGNDIQSTKFEPPDYTSLNLICFASNKGWIGQNLPNYEDTRESHGFKNIIFENAKHFYTMKTIEFATDHDKRLLCDNTQRYSKIHVACHELIGHTVGRLIYKDNDS